MYCFTVSLLFHSVPPAEGAVTHQGEEESSESDGDEPSLNPEPKTPPSASNAGDSHPGSAVHRPKGTQRYRVVYIERGREDI